MSCSIMLSALVVWIWVNVEIVLANLPMASPFFFLCRYHGDMNTVGLVRGEVSVSVMVKDDPEYYEPGKIYEVTISSNSDFDGLLMTGVYTVSDDGSTYSGGALQMLPFGVSPGHNAIGMRTMCSILHSHLSHRPSKVLKFLWMAPPAGTGCVNFLITATLRQDLLFKDLLALQLCEKGDLIDSTVPQVSNVHIPGFVLREDFEDQTLNVNIWSGFEGGEITDRCGNIMHGKAAVFCQQIGGSLQPMLATSPLNTTTASTVKFVIGAGNCSSVPQSKMISVLYGLNRCTDWHLLEKIRIPSEPSVHIICLPSEARIAGICIKWLEEKAHQDDSQGCWAVDSIAISNTEMQPASLYDDFDPVDPSNWLFFPGGSIKRACRSKGEALIFDDNSATSEQYLMSRPLDLAVDAVSDSDVVFRENFDTKHSRMWNIEGGSVGHSCALFVSEGLRSICSPYLNMSRAGNLRFLFAQGDGACSGKILKQSHKFPQKLASVEVYAETSNGDKITLSDTIHVVGEDVSLVSLTVPFEARTIATRLCWKQKHHSKEHKDVWSIADVIVLPDIPSELLYVLQLQLNLDCEKDGSTPNDSISIDFTPDHGHTWHALHTYCLPPVCNEDSHSAISSVVNAAQTKGWSQFTFPLPYASLVKDVQFKISKTGTGHHSNFSWGIDEVFVGLCNRGCSGHGHCTLQGCKCQDGYTGDGCEISLIPQEPFLTETFSLMSIHPTENVAQISGAVLVYDCGILGSGRPLVFNQGGHRGIITKEIDTRNSKRLEFTVRIGSSSVGSSCKTPDKASEAVYVHYSCNGALTWNLLEVLEYNKFEEARHVSISLPKEASCASIQFRIWQAHHSGPGHDVWALDDLSISDLPSSGVNLKFDDQSSVDEALHFSQGSIKNHCHFSEKALSFSENLKVGSSTALETVSLNVLSSYILQFEIIFGCNSSWTKGNKAVLEYSTDHGQSWDIVKKPCFPSDIYCNGEYTEGSVYESSQYRTWQRVTISLPESSWSSSTRFRFWQIISDTSVGWAIRNLYIGPPCPDLCNGHGQCVFGVCQCNDGFIGKSCTPGKKLKNRLKRSFDSKDELLGFGLHVAGGRIVDSHEGCGTIVSGSSVYFYEAGPRHLVTEDMDTQHILYVQFFIRIGGGSSASCSNSSGVNETVLVQYSNDGGMTWRLLKELYPDNYRIPRLEHIQFPSLAQTVSTRLRWWQPLHSGENQDQWALDEVLLECPKNTIGSNVSSHPWSAMTSHVHKKFCGSNKESIIVDGTEDDKFMMTHPVDLKEGEYIYFKISVGCSGALSWDGAVYLEYSHTNGASWNLVQDATENPLQGGSIYMPGLYGFWTSVAIPITRKLSRNSTILRWIQKTKNNDDAKAVPFSVIDFSIGPACVHHCSGHGTCEKQVCHCSTGFHGKGCENENVNPSSMEENFDSQVINNVLWKYIYGGKIGISCGVIAMGNELCFTGDGVHVAQTVELNTTKAELLSFVIQINDSAILQGCPKQVNSPKQNIFVDCSTDNGLLWKALKELSCEIYGSEPHLVRLSLPSACQTSHTLFRWWQPFADCMHTWSIDSIVIRSGESFSESFQDDFSAVRPDNWFTIKGGEIKFIDNIKGKSLSFSTKMDDSRKQVAETWDFRITPATFLQWDIKMESPTSAQRFSVVYEYSIDRGHSWLPLAEPCLPPAFGCSTYTYGSILLSEQHQNWTRITSYLPQKLVHQTVRFRWRLHNATEMSLPLSWFLDNVYLGDGCPWMCSGNGYCNKDQCICDSGYVAPYCSLQNPLPCELRDTFNHPKVNFTKFPQHLGAEISNRCGVLISGSSLVFYKDGVRMLETQDLNFHSAQYIQFVLKYGCHGTKSGKANGTIIVQFSNNAGITWKLLKELYLPFEIPPTYFVIPVSDIEARTNSTRIRIWQPYHKGFGDSEWAIDDLFIGGTVYSPNTLYDPLNNEPLPDVWFSWPGGRVSSFCLGSNHLNSLVFMDNMEGERAAYTRDIRVSEDTVIQFDIKVGCKSEITKDYPVRLEYSRDQGISWHLVKPVPMSDAEALNVGFDIDSPSVYFSNAVNDWQRIVIPLQGLHITGIVRFRWYQGFFSLHEMPPPWALDNVYIGMSCPNHCSGHGSCLNGVCLCDIGYEGTECHLQAMNPVFLKETFEGAVPDPNMWERWSGGVISGSCGILAKGLAMHFHKTGERMLQTKSLDLTSVESLQFYLKLGCDQNPFISHSHIVHQQSVLLHFSTDGGIHWHLLEKFMPEVYHSEPFYVALEVPLNARMNDTKLRWWQPSNSGLFYVDWAIDQVILGTENKNIAFNDDFTTINEAKWLLLTDSVVEPLCGRSYSFLHFRDGTKQQFGITSDVRITEESFLQFEITMGCINSTSCYEVALEFSTDMGQSWSLLQENCLPFHQEHCSKFSEASVFKSDLYSMPKRRTIPLAQFSQYGKIRFRWIQRSFSQNTDTWGIAHLYIGDECKDMCSGHGRCSYGICYCDDGWKGKDCSISKSPLPTEFREKFSFPLSSSSALSVTGGVLSDLCGPVGSGKALHFYSHCSRQLEMTDMNLKNVTGIQFYFRYGCLDNLTLPSQNVLVQLSSNGGITWKTLKEMEHSYFPAPRYVYIPLDEQHQVSNARIRWWQPEHGGRARNDWAIDDVFIQGKIVGAVSYLSNLPHDSSWIDLDNVQYAEYCGLNETSAVGQSTRKEHAKIETADMDLAEDSVLQFWMSVGCENRWDDPVVPVRLEYSLDHGKTWKLIRIQCLPWEMRCNGAAELPSFYQAPTPWRRIIIPLPDYVTSKGTRFRWHQDVITDFTVASKWAVRDIYIGPSCHDHCNGHGNCYNGSCHCDEGYSGDSCDTSHHNLVYLKESFENGNVNEEYWDLVLGGNIAEPCEPIVEGRAMVFSGPHLRVLETVDLDLRDAKFIQYTAAFIGSVGNCGIQQNEVFSTDENVILQYSVNKGVSWTVLHKLDYHHHVTPQHNYHILPPAAKSVATRFRWWQGTEVSDPIGGTCHSGCHRLSWSLDDVYIGGSQINTWKIEEDFENITANDLSTDWWFYPLGKIAANYCSSSGLSIAWMEQDSWTVERSITTRELIVTDGHMIQFQIAVGCGEQDHVCTSNHSIRLEYRKEVHGNWELLQPECLPGTEMNTECSTSSHHLSSIYSASSYNKWTRVTILLPEKTYSSMTQFRWIQTLDPIQLTPLPSWSIDNVYIGESCPNLCFGRGKCSNGACICDPGFSGEDCNPAKLVPRNSYYIASIKEGFEGGISPLLWSTFTGGRLGLECGPLAPYGQGKHLYFNGCGPRQLISKELDTTSASKIMFVLRIGTQDHSASCHINRNSEQLADKSVLFQYTVNAGIVWKTIGIHNPSGFMNPQRVVYEISDEARTVGVQFRWWQPYHDGSGHDQWALDNIELIMSSNRDLPYHHGSYLRRG